MHQNHAIPFTLGLPGLVNSDMAIFLIGWSFIPDLYREGREERGNGADRTGRVPHSRRLCGLAFSGTHEVIAGAKEWVLRMAVKGRRSSDVPRTVRVQKLESVLRLYADTQKP